MTTATATNQKLYVNPELENKIQSMKNTSDFSEKMSYAKNISYKLEYPSDNLKQNGYDAYYSLVTDACIYEMNKTNDTKELDCWMNQLCTNVWNVFRFSGGVPDAQAECVDKALDATFKAIQKYPDNQKAGRLSIAKSYLVNSINYNHNPKSLGYYSPDFVKNEAAPLLVNKFHTGAKEILSGISKDNKSAIKKTKDFINEFSKEPTFKVHLDKQETSFLSKLWKRVF